MRFVNAAKRRPLQLLLGRRWSSAARRPLQIHELCQVAEEHMRAASMPSLGARYLPTRLEFRVSEADWRSLRPFEQHLETAIQEVFTRLAAKSRFAAAAERPEVVLFPASELEEGAPPVVSSDFGAVQMRATWQPGRQLEAEPGRLGSRSPARRVKRSGVVSAAAKPGTPAMPRLDGLLELPLVASTPMPSTAVPGTEATPARRRAASSGRLVLEVVATPFAGQGTARQSAVWICLDPELPADLVEAGGEGELETLPAIDASTLELLSGLAPSASPPVPTEVPGTSTAGAYTAIPTTEVPGTSTGIPTGIPVRDGSVGDVYLLRGKGGLPLLWAPRGVWVLGRDRRRSHWTPVGAPANLSGRHVALLRGDDGGLLSCDLCSTNGVYLAGERLEPLRPVSVDLPTTLEVGHEGALRIEISSLLEKPVRQAPEVMARPAVGGTVQEAIAGLVLR